MFHPGDREIRVEDRTNQTISTSTLQHPVFVIDFGKAPASQKLLSGPVLGLHLAKRLRENRASDCLRYNDDAIGVAKNPIARLRANACAFNGDIARDHLAAAFLVERANAAVEDRERHVADPANISNQAVSDASRCTSSR